MQKKDVKGRKKINQTNNRTKKKKMSKTGLFLKIAYLIAIIAALFFSYKFLDLELTLAVAILLFVITGIGALILNAKSKSRRRKVLSILVIIFLIMGIAGLSAFSAFMMYVKSVADPKYENAKLNTQEVSRIYDKDGREIAKLGEENREKVKYDQLPEILVDAIISIEDSRFFQHNGFDAPRFLKAIVGQVTTGAGAGGASTLTMQVVKNSFTDKYGEKTSGISGITRKFEDIYLAVFKLEKEYTKKEIIEFYVNNHFLGGNIYGVQEASVAYFGKNVTDLNISEAAILAGMFKSPNAFKPTSNPEAAAGRRKTVLYQMRKHGYITAEEEEIANAIPVEVLTKNSTYSAENPYQGYIDTVVDEIKERWGVNPYTTPLIVYTNLDRERQNGVNAVLNGETYTWIDDRVQCGVAVVESETGKVLAIGNGRNILSRNNGNADQFNYATQIRRQPGSTAKPLFDYGPGFEYNNWSTYQLFDDAPYSYSNGRSIKNWDNGYMGTITLRTALAHSRNIPALKAFQQVDNNKIRDFVTSLGIEPEICSSGYSYVYDLKKCVNDNDANDTMDPTGIHEAHAIGAFTGVSPLMMAGAYAAFSNGGYYNEPYTVSKIIFRQTNEEKEFKPERRQVMSDSTAFMIANVLKDISLTGGTPYNVAAKTGTTNYDDKTMDDYDMPWDAVRDSWVVGFSTKTVIAEWYGYDSLTYDLIQQGYILHNIPATMQKDYIFNALVNSGAMEGGRSDFAQPSSVVRVAVAKESNPAKLAPPGTEGIYEYFKKGFEPTEYDLTNVRVGAPSGLKATENNGKVTLTWNAVDPGLFANAAQGKWGYNVYKDGVLVDWTSDTSYTYTPSSPYGKYKVLATYKGGNTAQSDAAEVTIEKQETPDPDPTTPTSTCPSDAIYNRVTKKCECRDSAKEYDEETKKCKLK